MNNILQYLKQLRTYWWLSPNVLIYKVEIVSFTSILHRLLLLSIYISILFIHLVIFYYQDLIVFFFQTNQIWILIEFIFVFFKYFVFLISLVLIVKVSHALSSYFYLKRDSVVNYLNFLKFSICIFSSMCYALLTGSVSSTQQLKYDLINLFLGIFGYSHFRTKTYQRYLVKTYVVSSFSVLFFLRKVKFFLAKHLFRI